jgi:hypothetical protein
MASSKERGLLALNIEQTGVVSAQAPSGATITATYLAREIPVYGIQDQELDQISNISADQSAAFSISAFLAGLSVGPLINAAFADKVSDLAKFICYMSLAGLILAAYYLLRGFMLSKRRQTNIDRIRAQTKSMPITP